MRFLHGLHAVLPLAGLAGVWLVLQMPAQPRIPEAAGTAASIAGTADPTAARPSLAPPSGSAADRPGEWNADSAVRYLLGSLQRGERFRSYRLAGIVADPSAQGASRAVIEDLEAGTTRAYAVPDPLPDGSRLAAIKSDYVVLEKNGVRKRLRLHSRRDARSGPAALETTGAEGYKRIGEHEFDLNPYRVFRGDADRVLGFSLRASLRGGSMEGVLISGLDSTGPAHRLGLREGDVLLAVNGKPVDSLLNGVRACLIAHGSDDVEIRLRRAGRDVTLTYHLFWQGRGSWTTATVLRSRAVASLLDDASVLHLF
ncbi:MAG: PDZ domain-containing protein [Acidobacteria bacterium]|nr:PDZ domain-containing protein [Acidobacteriota bacterium]